MKPKKYTYFFLFIMGLLGIVGIGISYYPSLNMRNIQPQINFLQRDKEIATKDFYHAIESLIAESAIINNTNIQNSQDSQKYQQVEKPQLQSTHEEKLILHVFLNNKVLLNNKWFKLHDVVIYQGKKFVIYKIQSPHVTLQNTEDSSFIVLDLFKEKLNMPFLLESN